VVVVGGGEGDMAVDGDLAASSSSSSSSSAGGGLSGATSGTAHQPPFRRKSYKKPRIVESFEHAGTIAALGGGGFTGAGDGEGGEGEGEGDWVGAGPGAGPGAAGGGGAGVTRTAAAGPPRGPPPGDFLSRLMVLASNLSPYTPVTDALMTGVRRLAARYPHHLGVWTLCRILDDRTAAAEYQGGQAQSSGLRKSVVRYAGATPDALPLLLLLASESLLGKSYRQSVAMYLEAHRLAPRDPLPLLGAGVGYGLQVMSRVTANRHAAALRCFAFLAAYRRQRLAQAGTLGEAVASLEALAGAGSGAGAGGPAKGGKGKGKGSLLPLATPTVLPRFVVEAETQYNFGRACHQLGILHLAVHCYEATLRAWDEKGDGDGEGEGDGGGGGAGGLSPAHLPERVLAALDIRREAAYNLAGVLKASGEEVRAAEVTRKYLSFDV
jgi:hypothetical protein